MKARIQGRTLFRVASHVLFAPSLFLWIRSRQRTTKSNVNTTIEMTTKKQSTIEMTTKKQSTQSYQSSNCIVKARQTNDPTAHAPKISVNAVTLYSLALGFASFAVPYWISIFFLMGSIIGALWCLFELTRADHTASDDSSANADVRHGAKDADLD